MFLIGRKGHKSQSYPTRIGGSPIAAIPFVQLGLSAPIPYTAGSPGAPVLFDRIVYESSPFGALGDVGGTGDFYRVPFGVYLATLQLVIDGDNKSFTYSVGVNSASGTDGSGGNTDVSVGGATCSAVRLTSETPLPGAGNPCAVIAAFIPPAVGDGEIGVLSKLFLWQLQQF